MLKRLIEIADELEEIWWFYAPIKLKSNVFAGSLCEVKKKNRISICTTCMNRLDDLKLTLPKNIQDNKDYPNIEFILLDYNSTDGLSDWVKNNLYDYIESKKLIFYRTEEPKHYKMSHSRNVVFKLASGDIVSNVDADNYTKKGLACYVNQLANAIPSKATFIKSNQVMHGRIGFYKKEFVDLLGGYDEGLVGYGFDDRDLFFRSIALGFTILSYGKYYNKTANRIDKNINYDKDSVVYNTKYIEWVNKVISMGNLLGNKFKANEGLHWGKAKVIKNFSKEISI